MARYAVLLAFLFYFTSLASTAVTPNFVVVSDSAALLNQTRATLKWATQAAYQEFQLSSSSFLPATVQQLRLSALGSAGLSELLSFIATAPTPSFYFLQANAPALALELARQQARFGVLAFFVGAQRTKSTRA